ncbi:Co2+/Mg2+ efflux protein ApaG [Aliidiomarina taiwanensis]|uniref:Protein ApaG n=1 Tax=Aliidiomarina taiwanensis TaxID=946228 RepID=A0A432X1C0_9GAMM|nr:Co2+/Mg2+ efflux protein ApaG [Aliidiomarina taiwanensis]RUO40062.1 Co2+/Mg2+ efflux protein ApaG [Aliidiomarina taiwanensis]
MSNNNVSVKVKTMFLPAQSESARHRYVFAYTITITNQSEGSVQLMDRAWTITDANGEVTEVKGAGVVGQQPIIEPGDSFTYTSGTVLETPVGVMEGYYGMRDASGESFQLVIPQFRLAQPNILH